MTTEVVLYLLLMVGLFLGISRGVGSMAPTLRGIVHFSLDRAAVGIVDLFSKNRGSAAVNWMTMGVFWLPFAATLTFINLWYDYDPTALTSAIGEINADGLDTATNVATFWGFLSMTLIGAGLHIQNRVLGRKMSSEAGGSLIGVAWMGLTALLLVISFTDMRPQTAYGSLFFAPFGLLALGMLANHLITIHDGGSEEMSISSWLVVLSMAALAYGALYNICYYLSGDMETVWWSSKALHGWWLVPMSMAIACYVVPNKTGNALWSRLLGVTTYGLIFLTLTPFMSGVSDGFGVDDNTRTIRIALFSALALVPIITASCNVLATMRGRWEVMVESPGVAASVTSMFVLPLAAIAGLFATMNTFAGDGDLAGLGAMMDHTLLWGIAGLAAFAAISSMLPAAMGKTLFDRSRHRWAFWLLTIGALGSSLLGITSSFVDQAVAESGFIGTVHTQENTAMMTAVMFYLATIGSFILAHQIILTRSRGQPLAQAKGQGAGITRYGLVSGTHTIRDLLGRGLTLDTEIVVNEETEEEDDGPTEIRISAGLHETEGVDVSITTDVADDILWKLAEHLKETGKTIFDVFKDIDEDSSMTISAYEFREGLNRLGLANLPPQEIDRLVAALDLNDDGMIDLPELGLAFTKDMLPARIIPPRADETADEEETSIEDAESLASKLKVELIEIASGLGLSKVGTKQNLIDRILSASEEE